MNVIAQQGDTVDLICWRAYGKCAGVTGQVYEANPGLCELGPLLPAGTAVYLPEIRKSNTRETVQLWD
ncbi:phage tail protein [Pantoea sp. Bo_2]|uniref:tail protein X n=1 Tax=unclassified Pantoea TaxID=2630326 RepID=UPI0012320B4F|nr:MULTISPECIES: tail protein X [unclassified Pantoea]KAA5938654.1 phage tail protein [Pantoea sp. VH_3]KAA5946828.1 phage tail protein [Pantoea sp. VH_25]KAA5952048.1 phage tail protein [Pantoea sp. VH_24]KAA5953422.1 phage tail protein [Pantoea sp. VH_16]KAA5961636.1 phage tail protein [Pantoea sp. VH_18]